MDTTKDTKTTVEQKTVTGHTPGGADVTASVEVKKKRKYSKGKRGVQELGRGVNRAANDLGKAVSIALESYNKRSDNSSRKKKDGMMRDAVQNMTKAASKGLKKAADAPYDLVKSVSRGKNSKQLRNMTKMISPPMFR
jgi:hypothetical protein